ncbi:FKBP-type peptidyl-prolyl cis-trans isomerase [Neisseria sicca]|uniref:FKBP-type peptidyl-prolyl cis-trans isomerase n=1 Tax=Neisseria sicca TaxID=490 RepID=UPI0034D98626
MIDPTLFHTTKPTPTPPTFPLTQLIPPSTQPIQLFKKPPQPTFYIPSKLPYPHHPLPPPKIPPNSTFLFHVKLLKSPKPQHFHPPPPQVHIKKLQ